MPSQSVKAVGSLGANVTVLCGARPGQSRIPSWTGQLTSLHIDLILPLGMTALSSPSIRLGSRRVPVVLPNARDPRLHTAAVILSIHTLGILTLGFRVSIPQIFSAIAAAAVIDLLMTFRRSGELIWPASGMLTGSGVALILRLVGMPSGELWSWSGWHYFAGIAALSVLTKYLIRFRGTHVFNPSNFGLVVAFLVLGASVIEPLDFWWAPVGPWMILAYLVILVGGVLITRRLNLLGMGVVFWAVLATGLGVLAFSGHCMSAAWSVNPVCGERFWTVLVTSPEVLVFLLFMITDPKTVPRGGNARFVFAGTLAVAATLLIAPQSTEFGAKVALLGSLVLWSPTRDLFDRYVPETTRGLTGWLDHLVGHGSGGRIFARGVLSGSLAGFAVFAIVLAGGPARSPAEAATVPGAVLPVIELGEIDLPPVVIDPSVRSVGVDIDQVTATAIAMNLVENLALEMEAIRTADASYLSAADGGDRLDEMQASLDEVVATGVRVAHAYSFESLRLVAAERPDDQSGGALAFEAEGTVVEVTFDPFGVEQGSRELAFASTFVLRQLGSERWTITEVLPRN